MNRVPESEVVLVPGGTLLADAGTFGRIDDVEGLRSHLQCAIELEHSTLPPYLCALYSLDRDRNIAAGEVLLSVFVEEMLHLALAANLLNAVGGRPRLDAPELVPGYPRSLPHGDPSLQLSLLPFGREAVQQFASLERPAAAGAPAQGDDYAAISQFYTAIRQGIVELCASEGEDVLFSGDPARQIDTSFSYGGSGRIIRVDDATSALTALDEIVEQGEGASDTEVWDRDREMFHPERDEVAHYYRMTELLVGRRYRRGDTPSSGPTGESVDVVWDAARPMRRNQRIVDREPGSEVRGLQEAFNVSYCGLLAQLEGAFDGHPELLGRSVGAMYGLKRRAEALMQLPIDGGPEVAGPTFEWVAPEDRR
jgi:hypothetical protein